MLVANHIIIAGNRQHRGRIAGVDRVHQALQQFVQPGVSVRLKAWNDNWRHEGEFLNRHRDPQPGAPAPLVLIYAYSWGFGWACRQLCRVLQRLSLFVHGIRSCDGIYRHSYNAGNWRALCPFAKIHLPSNVLTGRRDVEPVRCFVQRNSWVRGHRVYDAFGKPFTLEEIKEVIVDGMTVPATHYNIDESAEWIASCVSLAKSFQEETERRLRFCPKDAPTITA